MTSELIKRLLSDGKFPDLTRNPGLVETHISWVILSDDFAFKIKKPIQFSFLDFSTLPKREFYCERELELNRRLTDGIYLNVLPVKQGPDSILIGDGEGDIIDYAVCMKKIDKERQMDLLLRNGKVTGPDIIRLAEKIASFHLATEIIYQKDYMDILKQFNDLGEAGNTAQVPLNLEYSNLISRSIQASAGFLDTNRERLAERLRAGFFRDCHGDLHSGNVFMLSDPQPFDCIEFNDDLRQIDVLNEVAFLCMDLEAFDRSDLSELFLSRYNQLFPVIKTDKDLGLFTYYKSYRANIRAKVSLLQVLTSKTGTEQKTSMAKAEKYLDLMDNYLGLV